MSEPREFWFVHTEGNDQVENCFVLKSAYQAEKEAKEKALDRLSIITQYLEKHGDLIKKVENEIKRLEAGK